MFYGNLYILFLILIAKKSNNNTLFILELEDLVNFFYNRLFNYKYLYVY